MQLIPIPTTDEWLNKTAPHWLPFMPGIARGSKEPIESLLERVGSHQVQIILVWDEQAKQTVAIVGVQFVKRGEELIGEIIWCTGRNRKEWQHLIAEVENYLREMKCAVCRPICRKGWAPMLEKEHGYRTTHYVMEKAL